MADTRKDKRAPVSLKVRFKSATVDEFIEHYSKDVSRGGIFIKSSQPMPVGTLLKFQFQLKDESALIRGVGRVVWTRAEEDAGDDQPAGMGIKFIKMDNESRVTVERIVDSHEPEQGTYERGRHTATTSEPTSSAPPPATSGAAPAGTFFPNLPPAELPPPEDRTNVRQAAQFLASALTEAGTDKAATQEAQQKAEEARKRTQEIESERRKEAEQKKRKEPSPAEPLPSMIIDPSLEPSAASEADRATEIDIKPTRESLSVESARAKLQQHEPEKEPDTEPPPPMHQTTTTSIPHASEPERAPTRWLPIAVIAALVAIAAVVALRGGPEELPVEQLADKAVEDSPATIRPAPAEPSQPEPSAPAAAVEGAAPEAPSAEPPPSEPAVPPGELVQVEVVTTPRGAQVSVDDRAHGAAPVTLELALDRPVVVTASAPGYAPARAELTPQKKPAPLKLKLKALPYIVHVESTPPGASVNVGGHKGTTPVDLELDDVPTTELSVNAKLAGHDTARTRLAPAAFAESDGAMRASLDLTLEADAPGSAENKEATPAAPKERSAKRSTPRAQTATVPTPDGDSKPPTTPDPAAPTKADALKAEVPKSEAPKVEVPKAEAPKADAPAADAPKAEVPKAEPPKTETPKVEAPKEKLPDNPFGNE